jgi:hypothetical protein
MVVGGGVHSLLERLVWVVIPQDCNRRSRHDVLPGASQVPLSRLGFWPLFPERPLSARHGPRSGLGHRGAPGPDRLSRGSVEALVVQGFSAEGLCGFLHFGVGHGRRSIFVAWAPLFLRFRTASRAFVLAGFSD